MEEHSFYSSGAKKMCNNYGDKIIQGSSTNGTGLPVIPYIQFSLCLDFRNGDMHRELLSAEKLKNINPKK